MQKDSFSPEEKKCTKNNQTIALLSQRDFMPKKLSIGDIVSTVHVLFYVLLESSCGSRRASMTHFSSLGETSPNDSLSLSLSFFSFFDCHDWRRRRRRREDQLILSSVVHHRGLYLSIRFGINGQAIV